MSLSRDIAILDFLSPVLLAVSDNVISLIHFAVKYLISILSKKV